MQLDLSKGACWKLCVTCFKPNIQSPPVTDNLVCCYLYVEGLDELHSYFIGYFVALSSLLD